MADQYEYGDEVLLENTYSYAGIKAKYAKIPSGILAEIDGKMYIFFGILDMKDRIACIQREREDRLFYEYVESFIKDEPSEVFNIVSNYISDEIDEENGEVFKDWIKFKKKRGVE